MCNNEFILTNSAIEILARVSINPDLESINRVNNYLECINNSSINILSDGIEVILPDDFVNETNVNSNSYILNNKNDNMIYFYKNPIALAA